MEFPLEDRDKCFKLNYPKCLGVRTKCPNLHECHYNYSGVLETGLLRTVDNDIKFWRIMLISYLFIPVVVMMIWYIITVVFS